jgi:nitrate reductase beta subunit
MTYPYEERHPQWQFAFVFNINRCIACQTCTMACKSTWTFSRGQEYMWWNNVETKPYGGYPHHWDAKLLAMLQEEAQAESQRNPRFRGQVWDAGAKDGPQKPYGVFQGLTIFEASEKRIGPEGPQTVLGYLPTEAEWRAPNLYEDSAVGGKWKPGHFNGSVQLNADPKDPAHRVWFFYLARICNHCTYPGCLGACPRQAIYKRPEDGIALIDQSRCRGYRKCVEGCPYKKVMYRGNTGTSEKCIACYPRVEGSDPLLCPDGAPIETRCMSACIGKIRLQGLVPIDQKTGQWAQVPENPLYYLIRERQVALPLYPQFGTEPNGYYIPPRWVPRSYLYQMFGPGVDHALEQYSCPDRDLLAVLQLFRAQRQILFKFKIEKGPKVAEVPVRLPSGQTKIQEIFNDTVIGYNKFGHEVVRVTIEEPIHDRDQQAKGKHANSI